MARSHPGATPGPFDEAAALVRRARRRLRERRCRLSVRPRLFDGRDATITMLENFELLVDCDDRGLSQSLMADGYWEMWLTEAIEAVLKPGMVAIDIGANLGYFSMVMAKCVGPAGRVHAFEPNPNMSALLIRSAARNGFDDRICVHAAPLWDIDGEERILRIPAGEPKNAHLERAEVDDDGLLLTTRRLDSFDGSLDADLIKIDVEGAEEHVWLGMEGLFARARPLTVFLEFTPIRYNAPDAFLAAIEGNGFKLHEISVSHGVRPMGKAEILAGDPQEDRMLALIRR